MEGKVILPTLTIAEARNKLLEELSIHFSAFLEAAKTLFYNFLNFLWQNCKQKNIIYITFYRG